LLTCKQFMKELSEFLDESLAPELREELQKHVNECPNCWVVCDTTEKTIRVFKGMDAQPVPSDVQRRLLDAVHRKIQTGKACKHQDA
jgi:anti-sigma factor (TIGR02949 family)